MFLLFVVDKDGGAITKRKEKREEKKKWKKRLEDELYKGWSTERQLLATWVRAREQNEHKIAQEVRRDTETIILSRKGSYKENHAFRTEYKAMKLDFMKSKSIVDT